jgi:hypothetical protein
MLIKSETSGLVEITLKAEALQNAKYKQEIERSSPWGVNASGPHYKMKIGSIDKFHRELSTANQEYTTRTTSRLTI